jgi:hypothetical protein
MAADRFRSAVVCAFAGHKWDWRASRGMDLPYRCERCGRYDDDPKIIRVAKFRQRFTYWSPLTFKVTRREFWIRFGTPYHHRIPALRLRFDLHYGWERTSEMPGVSLDLDVWRLRCGLSLGGFWTGEEDYHRALFRLWSDFDTEGLRYIGCWFGHDWREPKYGYISCDRCDQSEEVIESTDGAVAA